MFMKRPLTESQTLTTSDLLMAVDTIQRILFAVIEHIFALVIIAALLWQVYCCFYQFRLRRRLHLRPPILSRRSSYRIPYPPPPSPAHSPLHPSFVKLLPIVTYSSFSTAEADEHSHPPPECAICKDEFKQGDIGPVLPNCNHFFHLHCIENWLRSKKTCPLCRNVVNAPPKITSRRENTEASAGGEGQLENSSNVNLPPPIWCPRNTRQVIELEAVVIEIPEEDHRRRQRQSTSSLDSEG